MEFTLLKFVLIVNLISVVSGTLSTPLDDEPQVQLTTGSIKGKVVEFRGVKVYQFLSIPFAEPPLEELRFKKPVPKAAWDGVMSANKWGPHCLQRVFPNFNDGHQFREDCLVLNVFTTEKAVREANEDQERSEKRPVLVWIHGGGFNFGSANAPAQYDGTVLAGLKDVVVVSINYRLGAFGFLYLPELGIPGNMGLWDQRLALQWISENIVFFGGDPESVTIFGESAGSFAVSAHLLSPQSKGLFHNAIMQSGAIYDLEHWILEDIDSHYLHKVGCSSREDVLKCLASYRYGSSKEADSLSFWATYGEEFLPTRPEDILHNRQDIDKEVNVLLGTVGNEGALLLLIRDPITFHPLTPINLTLPHGKFILGKLFGQKWADFYTEKYLSSLSPDDSDGIRLAIGKALGDQSLTCPTYVYGRDLVKAGFENVYAYHQSQKPAQSIIPSATLSKWLPATHCDDIPFVFGHPFMRPNDFKVDDVILSHIMMDVWTQFARVGKPPQISHRPWLPWTFNANLSFPTLILDSKRLGEMELDTIEFCLNNWPMPMKKLNGAQIEPGSFAKISNHDEL